MVRVPLEELVLQIHLLRLGKAAPFLARVLQVRVCLCMEGCVCVGVGVGGCAWV